LSESLVLHINGRAWPVAIEPHELLLDVLRDRLGLTGTKKGCGTGECGACTVLIDGAPANACLVLAARAEDIEITTVEGLGDRGRLHPLQQAFIDTAAVQCGFCAPGLLLSAAALLQQSFAPTDFEIRQAIAGNLCRCSGYVKIVQAVREAGKIVQEGRDKPWTTP
jgi:carbon-monoxide dehydrogenase small subunit